MDFEAFVVLMTFTEGQYLEILGRIGNDLMRNSETFL